MLIHCISSNKCYNSHHCKKFHTFYAGLWDGPALSCSSMQVDVRFSHGQKMQEVKTHVDLLVLLSIKHFLPRYVELSQDMCMYTCHIPCTHACTHESRKIPIHSYLLSSPLTSYRLRSTQHLQFTHSLTRCRYLKGVRVRGRSLLAHLLTHFLLRLIHAHSFFLFSLSGFFACGEWCSLTWLSPSSVHKEQWKHLLNINMQVSIRAHICRKICSSSRGNRGYSRESWVWGREETETWRGVSKLSVVVNHRFLCNILKRTGCLSQVDLCFLFFLRFDILWVLIIIPLSL